MRPPSRAIRRALRSRASSTTHAAPRQSRTTQSYGPDNPCFPALLQVACSEGQAHERPHKAVLAPCIFPADSRRVVACVQPTVPRGAGITRAADPCLQNPHGVFRTALVVSPERSGLALAVRPAGPAEAPGSTARRRRVPLAGCEAPLRMEGPTRTMHGVPVPVTVASPAMTQLTRRRRAPAQRA
jgi:hypothetical protein